MPNIKKNLIYSTFFQILSVITPFITAPYTARVLGADGIGIQSYTASVQTYFIMLAMLGTSSYGAREISRSRDDVGKRSRLFWEIEFMTVGTSFFSLCAWGIFTWFSTDYQNYYIILTLHLLAAMFDISWFFRGLEQFDLIVIKNTFFKIFGIVSIFLFVKTKADLPVYLLLISLSALLSNLSMWSYLRKFIVRTSLCKLQILPHVKETLIYFIPTVATSVYTVLDKTLIGLITNSAVENGYYQQTERIIGMAQSIVFAAVNSVVGVRVSYLFAENKIDEIRERIESSINYIFFMGVGCAFGIMGIAKTFVPLFFGQGYENVVYLLYIFSPIIVIIGISNCLGSHYYTPSGRRVESTKYIIAGSCINFLLNLLLIPKLWSYGAAIASIVAETTITVLYVRFSNAFCNVALLVRCGARKLIAGSVMFFIVRFLDRLKLPAVIGLAVQVVCGLFVYIMFLLILRDGWTEELVKNMLYKRKKKEND